MAAASGLELLYFGIYGRGGPIRDALAIGKVDYTNNVVAFPSWPALKGTLPTKTLPTLIIRQGGETHTIGQSNAILTFVGKLTGLYPWCPIAALKVDSFMATVEDVMKSVSDPRLGSEDAAVKAAGVEAVNTVALPAALAIIEALIPDGASHVTCGRLTVADLKLRSAVWFLKSKGAGQCPFLLDSCLDAFPKINAVAAAAAAAAAAAGAPQ
eukprot:c45629_g1_i1.p2 GENE.c45629_g1_i1~~c45629_g1_i1.p2  ORF type:complete len:212 (-),score=48.07 c45629_g1_i1:24-659(-)